MQAVLDTPMPPRQIQETAGTGLNGGEVGDEVDDLLSRLAGLADGHGAPQAGHLTHQRPAGSQIVVEATTDLDRAAFSPSPMPIEGAVLLKGRNDCIGITERGGQIGVTSVG